MSDAQGPTERPIGGPSWMRDRRPPTGDAPSTAQVPPVPGDGLPTTSGPAVGADLTGTPGAGWRAPSPTATPGPAVIAGEAPVGVIGHDPERVRPPELQYSRHAITPVPFAVAALASIAALLLAINWGRSGRPAGDLDTLRTLNEVWFSVQNLLTARLTGSILRTPTKATVVLVLSAVVAVAVVAWVGRIGRNLPLTEATFGTGLAVLGLPAWWTLALTVGTFDDPSTTRIDLLARLAFAAGLLTLQFILVRWGLLNRIWRAGRLPFDQASVLLWLPEFIPWMMFLGSSIFTLAITEDGEVPPDTWLPTPAMVDWGQALSALSTAAILVLLVVVTVRQQLGMASDRRIDEEAREADRRNRLALEVIPS